MSEQENVTTETESPPAEAPKPAGARHVYTPPDEQGCITRDGVFICRFVDGVLLWESEEFKKQFTPPVHKGLKASGKDVAAGIVSPMFISSPSNEEEKMNVAPARPLPIDPLGAMTVEQRQAVLRLRRNAGFPDTIEARPPGKKPVKPDKFIGIKAEKYVMDLLRYDPAKFVETYGVVRIGRVMKVEKRIDPETKVEKKYQRVVEAVLSRRKTHLTERAEGPHIVDDDEEGGEA